MVGVFSKLMENLEGFRFEPKVDLLIPYFLIMWDCPTPNNLMKFLYLNPHGIHMRIFHMYIVKSNPLNTRRNVFD